MSELILAVVVFVMGFLVGGGVALEVTHREHNIPAPRRRNAASQCRSGHPRTPKNTYTAKDGRQRCRICRRMAESERQSRRRQEGANK